MLALLLILSHLPGVSSFLPISWKVIGYPPRVSVIVRSSKLPDDPASLKVLVKAKQSIIKEKEAALKGKDTMINLITKANEEALKDKNTLIEVVLKDKETLETTLKELIAVQKKQLMNANTELLRVKGRLGCRFVIEKMEYQLSEVRRKNVKAPRTDAWKSAFQDAGTLLMMRRIYGDELSLSAAAQIVADIYSRCSTETHSPGDGVIPIRLGMLNENEARVMVQLCELYPVKYQVYDSEGCALDNAAFGGVVW